MTLTALDTITSPTTRRRWGFTWRKTFAYTSATIVERATNAHRIMLPGGQVFVRLEAVEDGFVAADARSGMFGEGATAVAAVRDLVEHLQIALRGLEVREARLSPELRDELQRLRTLFGK